MSIELIKKIRAETSLPLKDIKKAIEAVGQDDKKIMQYLKEQGAVKAADRSSRQTNQGGIFSYVHEGRLGVMIEIKCETDFVARSDDFQEFGTDVALHIAAYQPQFISPDQVDQTFIEAEMEIAKKQLIEEGKPESILDKILAGKRAKLANEVSLLAQPFIKNTDITVQEQMVAVSQKTGEKIVIEKFVVYSL